MDIIISKIKVDVKRYKSEFKVDKSIKGDSGNEIYQGSEKYCK